jgi:hypothetical protein
MPRRVRGLWLLLPIVAFGVMASLAVDLDTVKTLIGSSALRVGIKALALIFSAGAGVYSYIRSEQRHSESSRKQEQREAISLLEATLASSIQNLFVGELVSTIRANLMVVADDELQMLVGTNMVVFPDSKVRLRKGQGCAGAAWQQAVEATVNDFWKPVVATNTDLTTPLKKSRVETNRRPDSPDGAHPLDREHSPFQQVARAAHVSRGPELGWSSSAVAAR